MLKKTLLAAALRAVGGAHAQGQPVIGLIHERHPGGDDRRDAAGSDPGGVPGLIRRGTRAGAA